jgi:hypothetical protein
MEALLLGHQPLEHCVAPHISPSSARDVPVAPV